MEDSQLDVTVRLKRHGENGLLVVIAADRHDEEPEYFFKLLAMGDAGFSLDPVNDPHRIGISDQGIYGGEFIRLDHRVGGFSARPPQALIDLLLPNGAVEATYPCQAESGYEDLFFTLPDGGSLLSLFFEDLPPSRACEAPVGACTDTSLVSA